jgi:hypothetical protein
VGFTGAAGIPVIESTATSLAAGVVSGAVRDTWAVASGTALNSASSYAKTFCAGAGSDQPGTLYVVGNNDNGAQFYPVGSIALSQFGLGGNYGGEVKVDCIYRYMKAYFVNGATPNTRFTLSTVALAN